MMFIVSKDFKTKPLLYLPCCFHCYLILFSVNVNESRESELEHSVNVRFRYCETRIDYMGTCILMGNVSSFRIAMSDDWKTNLTNCPSSGKFGLLFVYDFM